MSRSIHITIRKFRGLTKDELKSQLTDPESDLSAWAKKGAIKKQIKAKRRKHQNY